VRGRGLETELRGKLAITGTATTPEIRGRLRTVRGTFRLLDRDLQLTEGNLFFRGPPLPSLRMVAETTTRDLTAGVRIEGPVTRPDITLTSDPPRPQDEILAYLLFGRELRSITPLQGLQLAQALNSLRGGGEGLNLLGKTRNLLGVDRLNFGQGEDGGVAVGAGKYISDRVYLGVEGGAGEDAGKVKAEIELNPRFTLESETGARSSGVRLNWKKDY
jgi:autotransporter translocation and assembly factor TamB